MNLDFYKLKEQPFGDLPDTRFLFMSRVHRQALGSLLQGLQAGCGSAMLIAKPGLGKTTLLFHLLHSFKDTVTTVYIFQAVSTPVDLFQAILADLGVRETGENPGEMLAMLEAILAGQRSMGKRVVVVIDEAQNLCDPVLDSVWMLSNLQTASEKLIQFVLCGRSQVADRVASPGSTQLRQQVSVVAYLEPFSAEDTSLYVEHRLRTAGYDRDEPLFTAEARELIARYSQGVPRKINNLCYQSISLGYKWKRERIEADIVRRAAGDLDPEGWRPRNFLAALPLEIPPLQLRQEMPPLQLPAFTTAAIAPAGFSGVERRAAIACTVALVLIGALFGVHRSGVGGVLAKSTATPAGHSPSAASNLHQVSAPAITVASVPKTAPQVTPTVAPVVAQSPKAEMDLRGMDLSSAIRALSGRSLNGICAENFGKCDGRLLQEIHKVNPRLSGLDRADNGHHPAGL